MVTADAEQLAKEKARKASTAPMGKLKPDHLTTDYVLNTAREPVSPSEPSQGTGATEAIPTAPIPTAASPQVVYVSAPKRPVAPSNRPLGILVVVASTVLFAILLAFATLISIRAINGYARMQMLANYGYWIPVAIFAVVFAIVVLVVNREGWWAHIIGSAVVAVAVYLGSALIVTSVDLGFGYSTTVWQALASPVTVAAAIISREISLWAGLLLGRRGRTLKARHAEAVAAFEREQASATVS